MIFKVKENKYEFLFTQKKEEPRSPEHPQSNSINQAEPLSTSDLLDNSNDLDNDGNVKPLVQSGITNETDSSEQSSIIEENEPIAQVVASTLSTSIEPEIPEPVLPPASICNSNWLVLHDSVVGTSHPNCEDHHEVSLDYDNNWGIAIICDGAGFAQNAKQGSTFVAENIKKLLTPLVEKFGWHKEESFPSQELWHEVIKQVLTQCYRNLSKYAKDNEIKNIEDLSCTVIITIFTPHGLLTAHIGDGRACYRDKFGNWHSMMKPFVGNDKEGTVFLATDFIWGLATDVFIESRVIKEEITAFALLTDGCEIQTFMPKLPYKEINNAFLDPNQPKHEYWENKVYQYFTHKLNTGISAEILQQEFSAYLTESEEFSKEEDDKTIVFGIYRPSHN